MLQMKHRKHRAKFKRLPSVFACMAAVFLACLTSCGAEEPDEAPSDSCKTICKTTCFIYTDGLLDDLCAAEYLSEKYDSAVILLQDPEGLSGNEYGSDQVKTKKELLETVSGWFSGVTEYSASTDLSETDIYLLAPLTEFAALLKEDPSLKSAHALMMAGDSEGPEGGGNEWNAASDPEAYRYVTENMTDLTQITAPRCEAVFLKNGYPFHAEFLDEYINHMESMGENVCCYDLQAAAYGFGTRQ